mmetsp:Transcript_37780/g.91902  ORF Transcript_37780/g.91902 Transcript_37780/m.91902 type:complete len:470 (+) Transcript_37780:131-1540(+)
MTTTTTMSEDMNVDELLSLGDSYYVDEQYDESLTAYTGAWTLLQEASTLTSTPSSSLPSTATSIAIRVLSHRSACFFKLDRYQESYDDALEAIKYLKDRPTSLRQGESELLHRRAGLAAMSLNNKWDDAKLYFEKALELATLNNSKNSGINKSSYKSWIDECNKHLAKNTNNSSKSGNTTTTTTTTSTSTTSTPKMSSSAATTGAPTMPKYQYYQNEKFMTVSILEPNVHEEDLTVDIEPQELLVILKKRGKEFTVICGPLFREIDVDKSKVVVKDEKVLVKLKKIEIYDWPELIDTKPDKSKKSISRKKKILKTETPNPATATSTTSLEPSTATAAAATSTNDAVPTAAAAPASSSQSKLNRPYASHKDWDSIGKTIEEEEEKETPQGDAAMNKLFQQIYANASDETRRAMVKSFQTSGGTVLSTNWDEVKEKDYEKERTAPDGVEWKDWEGNKLPAAPSSSDSLKKK